MAVPISDAPEDYMDGFWAILVIGVLVFLWGYGDMISGSHKIASRARDQLHKERLMAMEKGLPPPDGSFDEALLAYVSDDANNLDSKRQRVSAFGWAIVLILGGIGWTVATMLVPRDGAIGWLNDSFSFGFIPVLLGLGIGVHALVSRLTR
jgi:hypothetical protein